MPPPNSLNLKSGPVAISNGYIPLRQMRIAALWGPHQVEWLDYLSQERENIRAALTWAEGERELSERALEIVTGFVRLWWLRGPVSDGLDWMSRLLPGPGAPPTAASVRARTGLAILLQGGNDFSASEIESRRAAAEARVLKNDRLLGEALLWTASTVGLQSSDGTKVAPIVEECRPLVEALADDHTLALLAWIEILAYAQSDFERDWEQQLGIFERAGDQWLTGSFVNFLGELARERGNTEMARRYYRMAIEARAPVGGRTGGRTWAPFVNLAYMALMEGNAQEALPLLQSSLRNAVDVKTRYGISAGLLGSGFLAALVGEGPLAARLLGHSEQVDLELAFSAAAPDLAVAEAAKSAALKHLDEDAFVRNFHSGRDLKTEDAVRDAEDLFSRIAAASEPKDSRGSRPGGLSRQEAEVLRMLAAGHTNREIAANLVLSVRTVENHISNAYAKINARGRAEATAWAIANGIATNG